ncbi:hypothetical protein J1614_005048 [Plenodomus biglobosus]|nr:hypothetical protein J1614_005048 [Plenodomus biglobosus]
MQAGRQNSRAGLTGAWEQFDACEALRALRPRACQTRLSPGAMKTVGRSQESNTVPQKQQIKLLISHCGTKKLKLHGLHIFPEVISLPLHDLGGARPPPLQRSSNVENSTKAVTIPPQERDIEPQGQKRKLLE